MATFFSEHLTKSRKEAGFPTAYKFYHDNGGAQTLKISYRNYLLFEQGKLLPSIGRFKQLFYALRLLPQSFEANNLIASWLKTLAGEETYKDLFAPILKLQTISTPSPLHKAMGKALNSRKAYISVEQIKAIHENKNTYICSTALENDSGAWLPEDLAKALRISVADTFSALKSLEKAKVVRRQKDGRYTCPFAASMTELTPLQILPVNLADKIRKDLASLIASGKTIFQRRGVIRADDVDLRNYMPILNLNVESAQAYSITQKTKDSGIYVIEGRVVKLIDF